jgi:hypothetical protein
MAPTSGFFSPFILAAVGVSAALCLLPPPHISHDVRFLLDVQQDTGWIF